MRKYILILLGFTLFLNHKSLFSQTNFYDISSVREIKIYFDQPNWDYILDSLYVLGNEDRLVATSIIIDGTQLDSVGVRYKGYSSASVNYIKNPFNIKLNYIKTSQSYNNIDKLKLSNVIQDPSFVREALSYEIARKYMPASKANYANVFINDTLIGIYTNVEAVNGEFLQQHYGSSDNVFVKCNPENLDLFGENSNLNLSQGNDSTQYYPLYDMKSIYGWAGLYELMDTLNNYPNSIENVLNIDRTLWMHAFNYALINFDSYVGYAQNYYLYKDNNGRFNPILWDLNMSFASYRLADASIHFSGFTIPEAKTMDPLLHYNNVSVYPRPLMRNIFNNDRYRKMYIAHLRTIMAENFSNQDYLTRATAMQTLIDTDVQNDTNKFYSYTNFQDNLTSTVNDIVDYPGITDLMDDRTIYLNTYPGMSGAPDITNISSSPTSLAIGDSVWITAKISNADSAILAYRFTSTDLFTKVDMLDDGNNNDGIAGDSIYGFLIPNIGHTVEYYIYADNDSSGRFSPERAAYEYHEIFVNGNVVLNELCAINSGIWTDPQGEYEDWIELYNNSSNTVSLDGYYLSDDNLNLNKWTFPNITMAPNSYIIVWADKDTFDIGIHANFKLAATGESIFLSNSAGNLLDEITYGSQSNGLITFGRIPNGTGPWVYVNASFNAVNLWAAGVEEPVVAVSSEKDFTIYPNPTSSNLNILVNQVGPYQITIRDVNGREVISTNMDPSSDTHTIDINSVAAGFYIITLTHNNFISTKKFIIK
jgi:spore coat protein CotH